MKNRCVLRALSELYRAGLKPKVDYTPAYVMVRVRNVFMPLPSFPLHFDNPPGTDERWGPVCAWYRDDPKGIGAGKQALRIARATRVKAAQRRASVAQTKSWCGRFGKDPEKIVMLFHPDEWIDPRVEVDEYHYDELDKWAPPVCDPPAPEIPPLRTVKVGRQERGRLPTSPQPSPLA
jgi:hypothetical protein